VLIHPPVRSSSCFEIKDWSQYLKSFSIFAPFSMPNHSTDELKRNMEMGEFYTTMKRAQDYIRCVQAKDEDDMLAMVHISVTAWESFCEYKGLEYKKAYNHAFSLRFEGGGGGGQHFSDGTDSSLHAPAVGQFSNSGRSEIKKAIESQVLIAEQVVRCQKEMYLVNRWKRRVLQKMKKASTIEPQGYQAVPCL
jgi:hypothetical protein